MVNFYKTNFSIKRSKFLFEIRTAAIQIIVRKPLDLQKDQSKVNSSNKLRNKYDNNRSNFDNTYFDKNVAIQNNSVEIRSLK